MKMDDGYWRVGGIRGVPVFFHWTLFLWLPWFYWHYRDFQSTGIACVTLLGLLLAHEFGHAFVAKARGLRVFSIRLLLLHGQCEHDFPHDERDHILIAWAGVGAQALVLLAALGLKSLVLLAVPAMYPMVQPALFTLIDANAFMLLLNLIPVQPLDGFVAWRGAPLLWQAVRFRMMRVFQKLRDGVDFRRRMRLKKESHRLTEELIERLRK